MKIKFILPQNTNIPIGGYKIVYQYANKLVALGHTVSLDFVIDNNLKIKMLNRNHSIIRRMKDKMFGNPISKILKDSITWFDLDSRVTTRFNIFEDEILVDKTTKVVGTAFWTAFVVERLNIPDENKFEFIQNYENYGIDSPELVDQSFRTKVNKIVIAKWLKDLTFNLSGQPSDYVPNFIDMNDFFLTTSLSERNHVVTLLNHEAESKRTKFGLEVLARVKQEVPDLEVKLFGAYDPVQKLPDYVSFYRTPSLQYLRDEIYNKSQIYLLPSVREGWVLTGMEAMASGAAVISSDIGGVRDYMFDKSNALLIEPDNLELFVEKIVYLLEADDQRQKIVLEAQKTVASLSIEESVKKLLSALESPIAFKKY